MVYVQFISQCRQGLPPEGYARGLTVLRSVCGHQLFRERTTSEYLRSAEGGQIGPNRKHALWGQLSLRRADCLYERLESIGKADRH
jgi:hypothetical protein